jgi:hypothetical protein
MNYKYKYQVIEDNGGGLHLFIFRGDRPIAYVGGYEARPEGLIEDLGALDAGTNIKGWELDLTIDPCEQRDSITRYEYGWEIVATGGGGKRTLYPDRMGAAASLALLDKE